MRKKSDVVVARKLPAPLAGRSMGSLSRVHDGKRPVSYNSRDTGRFPQCSAPNAHRTSCELSVLGYASTQLLTRTPRASPESRRASATICAGQVLRLSLRR